MKNTRKLIPAIAMLLVSAVMLTTASYAWFTMTDKVTADGLQLQAEAAGSLLISQAPMDAASGAPSVDLSEESVPAMTARAFYSSETFRGATITEGVTTTGWYKPADGFAVDQNSGLNAGAFEAATGAYHEEVFYIATAGEAMDGADLTIKLTSPVHPSTGETHKAYAAAIYVYNKGVDQWAEAYDMVAADINAPTAIIFVDETVENSQARNVVVLNDQDIPTVYGATAENEVGLKVVVHYYVDGGLKTVGTETGSQVAVSSTAYTAASGKVVADTVYWSFETVNVAENASVAGLYIKAADGTVTAAYGSKAEGDTTTEYVRPVKVTHNLGTEDNVPSGWYTARTTTSNVNYTYIRSKDVQLEGSSLKLEFSAVVPTTPSN